MSQINLCGNYTTKMEQLNIKIMCRFERNINRIYTLGGIILLIIVVMAMSSCGTSKQCDNKMINKYRNW